MSETPDIAAPDIAALTFEQALSELEQIVARLESGQAPLEASIEMYRRGSALKAHCEAKLNAARLQVEKITKGLDGAPAVEPAEFS
jgi:exodeoxyribonuclease VII small subunit